SACATSFDARGRYHKVQHGENIWVIAKAYRVSVQDLAEINNVMDGGKIEPGRKLYIPQRPKGRMMKKLPKAEREKAFDAPIQTDHSKFIWPVNGTIFSNFGIRNGRRHDGIDIAVKSGTPIKAAADGEVAFSDRLSGYGNTVIIKHAGDFFTVYGHNQKNAVKKGQAVKKGSLIAYVGATGNATGSHCHFEIRNGQKARNPLFFLPVKH
ncbi:MAG: peptidoglycan DD-metalloendopeptidase family protein, partial [Deltaproteobacteria bacterium]|nr:peptidoglycan DD-metalloendopeptidase family protein [Deltaproteobacteria bacterium]